MRNSNLKIRIAGRLCRPQLGLDALSWIGFTFEPNRMQSMLGIPSQPPERPKTARLRVVPHFSSGIVERAKRKRT